MDINSRIRTFIEAMNLTSSQAADQAGIPRPSFSQILTGRNRKISNEVIAQLHQAFPTLNVLWLLFGQGDMLLPTQPLPHADGSINQGNGNNNSFGHGERVGEKYAYENSGNKSANGDSNPIAFGHVSAQNLNGTGTVQNATADGRNSNAQRASFMTTDLFSTTSMVSDSFFPLMSDIPHETNNEYGMQRNNAYIQSEIGTTPSPNNETGDDELRNANQQDTAPHYEIKNQASGINNCKKTETGNSSSQTSITFANGNTCEQNKIKQILILFTDGSYQVLKP